MQIEKAIVCLFMILSVSCQNQDRLSAEMKPLAIIADRNTKEADLFQAIERLGPVEEPRSFWVGIINNQAYNKTHRRYCVFQLFHRHIAVDTPLHELARILNNPSWLKNRDIHVVDSLKGKIPVKWTFDDTVIVLRVFPELPGGIWAIYLRVSGKVDRARMIDLLRGKQVAERAKEPTILEIGYSKP